MTAPDILNTCREAGIRIEAHGDRLRIEAPAGALTPELRAQLTRAKPAILDALRPPKYITLRPDARTGHAPTIRAEAIELAINLEARGFTQSIDARGDYVVAPAHALSDEDRAGIARWHRLLAVLVNYQPPECG